MEMNSKAKNGLVLEKLPGYFLLACLLVTLYFAFTLLTSIMASLFAGAVLAITFHPLYNWMVGVCRGRNGLASFLTCFIVVALTVTSLSLFAVMIAQEAGDTYDHVRSELESGEYDHYLQWGPGNVLYDWLDGFADDFDLKAVDVKSDIVSFLGDLTDDIQGFVGAVFSSVYNFLIGVFLMFFAMFYFFRDGDLILKKVAAVSPLPTKYENHLFVKVKEIVRAVMLGVFLTALLQGVAGGIGFAIAGISNPVFWAAVFSVFSLVPVFGTAIVLLPAVFILFVSGSVWAAVFLLIWGVLVIGSIDNIVRPILIQGRSNTYFPLMFFLIFGGLLKFGISAVIIGPLVLVMLISFLYIYEIEYGKALKG